MREMRIEDIREVLSYCPNTGDLTWLVDRTGKAKAGSKAGHVRKDGYLESKINNTAFLLHRVAWGLHYGTWPAGELDHIDGDKTNNRINNLRDVHKSQNQRNAGLRRDSTSGATGVSWFKRDGKWRAQISIDGRNQHLGFFDDFDDAVAARKKADMALGYHQNHGMRDSFNRSARPAAPTHHQASQQEGEKK